MGKKEIIKYDGSSLFRTKIIISTLTNQPIKLKNINIKDLNPGLKPFHISFLKLIEEISNGSLIEINETGTDLFYKPGLLIGGAFQFHCSEDRSLGYYLEGLISLAPYVKNSIKAKLFGVTNDNLDPSVDELKFSSLPLLKKFLNLDSDAMDLDIKIVKRCFPQAPKETGEGSKSGEILFSCPIYSFNKALCKPVDMLKPINQDGLEENCTKGSIKNDFKITKIRGIAYTLKVSPVISNRMINQCQSILKKIGFSNTYIRQDCYKKSQCGNNPGFGLCLYAETLNGCVYTGEACSFKSDESCDHFNFKIAPLLTPEEIASRATFKLLDEIYMGGSMDTKNQSFALLLMALASNNVSRLISGKLTTYALKNMKLFEENLKIKYKIDKYDGLDDDPGNYENVPPNIKYEIACLGSGFININKLHK